MTNLPEFRKSVTRQLTNPLMTILCKTHITPDTLTWIGLAISFDILDGALARFTNKTTVFGGLLDSTFDRLSEAVIFAGLLILYAPDADVLMVVAIFTAMIGSFLTSYIRSRAEGLGLTCSVGLFTRAERVIILCLGLLFDKVLIALAILVVLSFITVGQRFVHVWLQTRNKEN